MKKILKKSCSLIGLILLACPLVWGEQLKPPRKEISARIVKADRFLKAGKPGDVVSTLKPVAPELPRQGLLILSKAYHIQKNYLDESRVLEVILGMNAKDYYVQTLLGEAYLANRDFEKADENFAAAGELNPHYQQAFEGLEKSVEAQGQLEEARSITQDLIQKFGEKKQHRNLLCRLFSNDGLFQEGIDACQKAIAKDPGLADNHIYLGQMLIASEQVDRGEMIILKAAKQFQKSELAQFSAGDIKLKHKQWLAAGNFFSQGTIADPKSDRNFLGWGQALFEMQKFSDAKTALTKACTLNRKNLPELRKAIANLRQKNLPSWAAQYEASLPRCGG